MIKTRNRPGFSLIELVIGIVVVGIIAGVTVPLFSEVIKSWVLSVQLNDMCESARVAMDRMDREIRQINSVTGVLTANSANFQFVDANSNTITFNLSSGHLIRAVGGSSNQLADNVTSLAFTYYNSAGAVIATPVVSPSNTNIKRIVIDLTFTNGATQLNFESGVSPRRLQ